MSNRIMQRGCPFRTRYINYLRIASGLNGRENRRGRGGNICPISTPRPSVGLRVTQPKKTRVESRRKQGFRGRDTENWDRLNDGAAPGVVIKTPVWGVVCTQKLTQHCDNKNINSQ